MITTINRTATLKLYSRSSICSNQLNTMFAKCLINSATSFWKVSPCYVIAFRSKKSLIHIFQATIIILLTIPEVTKRVTTFAELTNRFPLIRKLPKQFSIDRCLIYSITETCKTNLIYDYRHVYFFIHHKFTDTHIKADT